MADIIDFQYYIDLPTHIKVPTLIAIAEYDDGVRETKQAENPTEAGAPKDFRVHDDNTKTDLTHLHNIIEISSSKSQCNKLLTSVHLDFLYKNRKKREDKNCDIFLNEQQKQRKSISKIQTLIKNIQINFTDCKNGVMHFHYSFV